MDIKNFLKIVCEQIKYAPARKGIAEELENHIQEIKEDYINCGIKEIEAEEKAVAQMGTAEEIGKKLNKIHRPKFDWKLAILILILVGFGLLVAILKSNEGYTYIGQELIYIIIGIALSVGIYFFDYRKIKSYSNLIYIVALLIILMPIFGAEYKINGMSYINLWGISVNICTISIPMFVIAFVGYIVDYDKNNVIKITTLEKEFRINKDLVKIIASCIFAIIPMLVIPSLTSAIILSFIYLVLFTAKILQDRKNRLKKYIILFGAITICMAFFLSVMPEYRLQRIITSFKPELDPQGSGYTGMLQKEILENAKLFGEAETEELLNAESIISKESQFTFIYLIGKIGTVLSGILVLIIILTCIKLILNAKYIKEQYGKFLIIGISSLYIFESIISVLMNLNLAPTTNINLPFVTYGGVFFLVNIVNMAIILSVYRRKDIYLYDINNEKQPETRREKKYENV